MQKIILTIHNPEIENILLLLSKEQNKSIENVTIDLLRHATDLIRYNKAKLLEYEILDPDKYMEKIKYNIPENVDMQDVNPFSHVSESAEYIKSIRNKTWRR